MIFAEDRAYGRSPSAALPAEGLMNFRLNDGDRLGVVGFRHGETIRAERPEA